MRTLLRRALRHLHTIIAVASLAHAMAAVLALTTHNWVAGAIIAGQAVSLAALAAITRYARILVGRSDRTRKSLDVLLSRTAYARRDRARLRTVEQLVLRASSYMGVRRNSSLVSAILRAGRRSDPTSKIETLLLEAEGRRRLDAAVSVQEIARAGADIREALTATDSDLRSLRSAVSELNQRVQEIDQRTVAQDEKRADPSYEAAILTADMVSLINLVSEVPIEGLLPSVTDFSVSPSTLHVLVAEAQKVDPEGTIVECGSGISTVWLAAACKQRGYGSVVALEHDARYQSETIEALHRCGLAGWADVRLAPLEYWDFDAGTPTPWYSASALDDLHNISLLFVDGPPGSTSALARYPAIRALAHKMRRHATVVLDDVDRGGEREALSRWFEEQDSFGYSLEVVSRTPRASVLHWSR